MFPNGNIGGFQHKLLKPFKVVYYHTKQSEQSTYAGSWYNSQHMAAFRLRKRTLHFMHIIQVKHVFAKVDKLHFAVPSKSRLKF